jgi:Ca2+-binding RTX toxin-like protein
LNVSLNNKKDDGEKNERDLISSDVENLTGGTGNDKIQGNDHKNTLVGLAGNDKIEGNKGNDESVGKEGSDILKGNQGDDYIDGGQGSNTCYLDQEDSESSSCQLLKDLGDLVVHVKGTIHNSDLKGC